MRSCVILVLVLSVLAYPIGAEPKGEDKWIKYSGHNMSFEYPAEWKLTENSAGVTVGEGRIFALDITMHKEECYPQSQHQALFDLLFLMHNKAIDGTPDGDRIARYSENEIGPYSMAIQAYKDPAQSLTCEIQGYTQKNATVIFAETLWKPQDSSVDEIMPKIDRLMESLIVTLPDKENVSSAQV